MADRSKKNTRADSEAAFLKARRVMPGGVSSPVRAFKAVGGMPVFIREGEGPHLTDIDGNTYIDYVGSYGPLIAGHANERVVAALSKAIGRGTSFGRADRIGNAAGVDDRVGAAGRRHGAVRQQRDGSDDERDPAGPPPPAAI